MRSRIYATIVDGDYPGEGEHYQCAIISHTLARARERDGYRNVTLRRRDHWTPTKVEDKRIRHIPSGSWHPAAIYRMNRK